MKPSSTFDASPLGRTLEYCSCCQMIRGNLELEERILVELTNTGEIKFNIGNIYVTTTPIFHQLPFFEQQTFAQCRHPDFDFKFQLKFSISPRFFTNYQIFADSHQRLDWRMEKEVRNKK